MECFIYVFQFYDANKMREVNVDAKEKLQSVQNIYRLLEDSLSSISSCSGALKNPFELRGKFEKANVCARVSFHG